MALEVEDWHREGGDRPMRRITSPSIPCPCPQCLDGLAVEERPVARQGGGFARLYTVRLHFHPDTAYPRDAKLSFQELATCATPSPLLAVA